MAARKPSQAHLDRVNRINAYLPKTAEWYRQWADGLITHAECTAKVIQTVMEGSAPRGVLDPALARAFNNGAMYALAGVRSQDQFLTWVCLAHELAPQSLYELLPEDAEIGNGIRAKMAQPG